MEGASPGVLVRKLLSHFVLCVCLLFIIFVRAALVAEINFGLESESWMLEIPHGAGMQVLISALTAYLESDARIFREKCGKWS